MNARGVFCSVISFFLVLPVIAQVRMVPHVTRAGGGFTTTITIENDGDHTSSVTLTPHDAGGFAFSAVSPDVPGRTVRSLSVTELYGQGVDVAYFTISGGSPEIQVSVAYRAANGPGSPAHVRETAEQAKRWKVFAGDWNVVFDGFAVVNTGVAATDVWVRQMSFSGQIIDEKNVISMLAPNAKGLYVIGSPQQGAAEFSWVSDTYFEVSATQDLAITALRGTPPGAPTGYLWENIALPLAPRDLGPMPLDQVNYWAYQIQSVNLNNSVDELAATHYDMLVLEPTSTDWSEPSEETQPWARDFDTRNMVDRLKDSKASDGMHRKLVIAYIDIGQAEDWRWYWTWDERSPAEETAIAICNQTPFPPATWPEYIVKCDPDNWLHNYPVLFWYDEWINIVIYGEGLSSTPYGTYKSIIDEVISDGFDGIYLDWVEAAEDEDIIAAANNQGLDVVQEMIWFIEDMRTYATARNPNFIIIQQNAASLIGGHPELAEVIDAIAQEATWFDGDATDDWNDPNGYDHQNDASLVAYYLGFLTQYLDAGIPVFSCEYALDRASEAYSLALDHGFVPYVTRRSLSALSTTPPPGY